MREVTLYNCVKGSFGKVKLVREGKGTLISEEGSFGKVQIKGSFPRLVSARVCIGNMVYR